MRVIEIDSVLSHHHVLLCITLPLFVFYLWLVFTRDRVLGQNVGWNFSCLFLTGRIAFLVVRYCYDKPVTLLMKSPGVF